MSTSILDLLDVIDTELADADRIALEDASAALHQAHSVLLRLRADGLEPGSAGRREAAAFGLAVMARTVADGWPQDPGRVAQLVGVVGDAVGKLRDELTRSDRWAITIRLGPIARRCAQVIEQSGPYRHVPELKVIDQSASTLRRLAASDPPDPSRCVGVLRPIPRIDLVGELNAAVIVREATAGMLDYVNLAGRPPISVREAVGVCRAAESLSRAVDEIVPGRRAVDMTGSWGVAASRFSQLEDGMRSGREDRLLRHALRAQEGLAHIERRGWRRVSPTDRQRLSEAAGYLAAIADGLDRDLSLRRPAMLVPVDREPLGEVRVGEWLRRHAFMSDRGDLFYVRNALAAAAGAIGAQPLHDAPSLSLDL